MPAPRAASRKPLPLTDRGGPYAEGCEINPSWPPKLPWGGRNGASRIERPPYQYSAFLSTRDSDELDQLCRDYPQRWRIEEFFNAYQALGWKRAGTTNLNVRYAQMSLALVAQAAVDQLRKRLGNPFEHWEAGQFGRRVLQGLDGDVRVRDDTVVVTFYNPPHAERLRRHYENLPAKLAAEGVDPRLPWLYGSSNV